MGSEQLTVFWLSFFFVNLVYHSVGEFLKLCLLLIVRAKVQLYHSECAQVNVCVCVSQLVVLHIFGGNRFSQRVNKRESRREEEKTERE